MDKTAVNQKNSGTTMVSVIVSFALLLLFVTGYFKVQKLSTEMMMNARDLTMNNSRLIKAFYLEETINSVMSSETGLEFVGQNGSFYVTGTLKSAKKDGLTGTLYYFDAEAEESEEQ